MILREQYDVIILGGGLAGLTLARQIKRADAGISVLIIEKRQHPVPEGAHKVGESTVEMGAYYLRDILGLKDHLTRDQLPKGGLRFHFPSGANADIEQRFEFGLSSFAPVRSYQLDRGRLENKLAAENVTLGVEFQDGCRVKSFSLGKDRHIVNLVKGDATLAVGGRWLVDSTGRACVLKRHLCLQKSVVHEVNAAWLRIAHIVDIGEWSDDLEWRGRVPSGFRRLATNHLLGRGYWVWLIPLASGSTSVGIVADATIHPFNQFNTFDRALEWLFRHEPQCAETVFENRGKLQDFLCIRHYAHGCERVFSPEGWALTGEAGVFLDPLYSPGTDFIALSNTFISDLILRDRQGQAVKERAEFYNEIYLRWFDSFLGIYKKQYPLLGNSVVMTGKLIWDFAVYWATIALIYCHNKLCDLEFLVATGKELNLVRELNDRMQLLFRDWDRIESAVMKKGFVDYLKLEFLYLLQAGLAANLDDRGLRAKLVDNRRLLESLAVAIFLRAAEGLCIFIDPMTVNPYAISLRPECWHSDALFERTRSLHSHVRLIRELAGVWGAEKNNMPALRPRSMG